MYKFATFYIVLSEHLHLFEQDFLQAEVVCKTKLMFMFLFRVYVTLLNHSFPKNKQKKTSGVFNVSSRLTVCIKWLAKWNMGKLRILFASNLFWRMTNEICFWLISFKVSPLLLPPTPCCLDEDLKNHGTLWLKYWESV